VIIPNLSTPVVTVAELQPTPSIVEGGSADSKMGEDIGNGYAVVVHLDERGVVYLFALSHRHTFR
jgi:hypothetical protein